VDPDPRGSAFILVGWISIQIHEGKNYQDKLKSEEISCFQVLDVLFSMVEDFSGSLDVLH
jgi:hypothetical protein